MGLDLSDLSAGVAARIPTRTNDDDRYFSDIFQFMPAQELYGPAGLTVRGTVARIATAVDPATRTMRVEIDVPNPDARLLPGTYAQVTLGRESQHVDPPKP